MILCDDNIQLLATEDEAYILRRNSMLLCNTSSFVYSEAQVPKGRLVENNGRIYEYDGHAIRSFETGNVRSCDIGPVEGLFCHAGSFYFVKSDLGRRVLVNEARKTLVELPSSIFHFSEGFMYSVSEGSVVRTDLTDGSCQRLGCSLPSSARKLLCRADRDGVLTVIADSHNVVHIHGSNSTHSYNWHDNKILSMVFVDDFLVTASDSGVVSRLNLYSEGRTVLFHFFGRFIGMVSRNNKIFLLSSLYFIVYDMSTDMVAHSGVLPGCGRYFNMDPLEESAEPSDVFKIKRKSCTVVKNSMEASRKDTTISSQVLGVVTEGMLFSADSSGIFGQFILQGKQNFISGEFLISIERRKKMMTIRTYRIFTTRLVLVSERDAHKQPLTAAYVLGDSLYLRNNTDLYYLAPTGIPEIVENNVLQAVLAGSSLLVATDKGILDIPSRSYRLKQRRITSFGVCDGDIIFCIAGKAIYWGLESKLLVADLNEVCDIILSEGQLLVMHIHEGKKFLDAYVIDDDQPKLVSRSVLDSSCSKILNMNAFITGHKQLLIQKE